MGATVAIRTIISPPDSYKLIHLTALRQFGIGNPARIRIVKAK